MSLCHLHTGGPWPLLHRNIKPASILVFPGHANDDTRPYRLKLAGFRAATVPSADGFVPPADERTCTQYSTAPEVVPTVAASYSTSSDVFAWGITMSWAIMKARARVADPYSRNRDGLVAMAAGIMNTYRPALAALLRACCAPDAQSRPSASLALSIVLAARHRGDEPLPTPVSVQAPLPLSSQLAGYVLDESQLVESDEVLGVGGSGKVLRGMYQGEAVCLKVRHLMQWRWCLDEGGGAHVLPRCANVCEFLAIVAGNATSFKLSM